MSVANWAIEKLQKHGLAVDFTIRYVEDCRYNRFYWGVNEDFETFEDALQAMVNIMENV
ncbi:hypothetical protein vBPpSSYP_101 [Pseudomonas phage vB_PpS_SYP]|nr:hypothetical protein vBPpSSYP_101 [Pseudomonas phage vB_PpS_SYP]